MTTKHLVSNLKENNQDFEFYPTTQEIIDTVKRSIGSDKTNETILDCGAGDGRVLSQLTNGKKYAIEKSQMLVQEMSPEIFVVGCEFHENSLIDKKVDIIFCNPPYSEYKEWATKIIREGNAGIIYLVIPERWKNQSEILGAIKDRKATVKTIGNFDFLEADRKARAKVEVLKIDLKSEKYYSRNSTPDIDPFRLWAETEFPINQRKDEDPESEKLNFQKRINELVPARGLVPALVELYQNEMSQLQKNFSSVSQLDASLLEELKIDLKSIMEFLRLRIVGLKDKYWNELFSNLKAITNRLTVESRERLLGTLTENISVDFNEQNIYAVTLWAIKNANQYFDSQLIDVFTDLVNNVNLINYKSNQKTWGNDNWRFREELRNGRVTYYGLDYRCVISCYNTFNPSNYGAYSYPNNLNKAIHDKLNDLITVADNLGFICPPWENSLNKYWNPGSTNDFLMNNGEVLMSVKAYKNGNIHIKFNQKFLRKLNVEFGRLKGWLRNAQQASEELNIPEEETMQYFGNNFCLECSGVKLLN